MRFAVVNTTAAVTNPHEAPCTEVCVHRSTTAVVAMLLQQQLLRSSSTTMHRVHV